jgi:polar amino acid transport system substrate-binding protein
MRHVIMGVGVAGATVGLALGSTAVGQGRTEQAAASCAPASLPLVSPGTITVGTDNPAYPPWYAGGQKSGSSWKINDPTTGKGYESAVAYAVARRLGFGPSKVKWVQVPFAKSFAPGKKNFDFFLNQVSATPQRAKNVDFSTSYYNVHQAIVALKGKPITKARTVAALKGYKLGAPIGTTSYDVIKNVVKPDQDPSVYDTLNDGVSALRNGQIDGLVVDFPTSYYITSAQVPNSTIVGQFKTSGPQEHFGLVLAHGSGLTRCVDVALAKVRSSGQLAGLEREWLSVRIKAPFFK